MKFLIVFIALFAIASAADIVRSDSEVEPEKFNFNVETSDGTKHSAEGALKDVGSDHEGLVVHGSFSYVGDDGKTYTVNYVADENGFQPQGAHLPVGPVA